MDIIKTAKEIGFFETGINLANVLDSYDIADKVGASMPLPSENIKTNTDEICKWLVEFGKSRYMFFTPEIAIIERLAELQQDQDALLLVPCDMDSESKTRLENNVPKSIKSELLNEPFFPEKFFPSNGLLVVVGYLSGNRTMVLHDTYRMLEHYGSFMGKKVFIPYAEIFESIRYPEWIEVSSERFNIIWRCNE